MRAQQEYSILSVDPTVNPPSGAEYLRRNRYEIKKVNRILRKASFMELAVIPGKDKKADRSSESVKGARKTT